MCALKEPPYAPKGLQDITMKQSWLLRDIVKYSRSERVARVITGLNRIKTLFTKSHKSCCPIVTFRAAISQGYHTPDHGYFQSFIFVLFSIIIIIRFHYHYCLSFFFLAGEIGGNMGLFLGCSVLTICEFVEFLINLVAARWCTRQANVSPA